MGINDSFEEGKSITVGIDYNLDIETKNNLEPLENKKINLWVLNWQQYLEMNMKTKLLLNLALIKKFKYFGTINNNLFENLNLKYDFSIDNDLKTFDAHSISSKISINNFITEFGFIENSRKLGSTHLITNKTSYKFDENNSFSFSTRRNKEISLTEYYDLSYEYKIDCLTAAVKYNKTFYQDDDLVPSENLFLSVTLIPLTTYERKIYERDQYGN